ncbi:helicase HerA domain-containing protein [Halobaculum sp. MBLA0143]|uniref:helicase HerA domain-containing protein n=1 Tax=Halobaculum sp. MBLA0143 TaxID=3079933 RepID=UPI0035266B33
MSEQTETITVADVSAGPGGASDLKPGTPISLPVVEILTGRGFITGKSGSGKSNTASVVIENLLDNNFPVLIVDSDGEYYGLKEEYEILHAGADEECDIQVSDEHAEKLAGLALEQNVPIILDVSGFLDEDVANTLVRETARHLFAKEKKLKKPFLMLVEECHEYVPEGAGLDDTGRTLIKIGKRGRKHGLGIVGISQRPADVKKDFITQCDWLCWHRLTWDNDTKVVKRILGSEYGDAIEEVDDGEAFLMTDWAESIRRVQFHRKQTFDAGATPGLDDFERPDLKDVSGDLVSELQGITDEQERRESELADLRQELDEKRQQITQLERELEEARDMSDMADTFAQALLQKTGASYRGGDGGNPAKAQLDQFTGASGDDGAGGGDGDDADGAGGSNADDADGAAGGDTGDGAGDGSAGTEVSDETAGTVETAAGDSPESVETVGDASDDAATPAASDGGSATDAVGAGLGSEPRRPVSSLPEPGDTDPAAAATQSGFETGDELLSFAAGTELRSRSAVVSGFVDALESLDEVTLAMLTHYRNNYRATPVEAHVAAGGSGDREFAYARNRTLRRAGVIEHVACGRYRYRLPELLRRVYGGAADEQELAETLSIVEGKTGLATEVDDE